MDGQGTTGRAGASAFAACFNDMNALLNCWKTGSFDDGACLPALHKFQQCVSSQVRRCARHGIMTSSSNTRGWRSAAAASTS